MVQPYALEKWFWTEADFESMGWHDARIYALAFLSETFEFALDIDYIFEWIRPVPPAENFSFWVSPCALVFDNVFELEIDLAPYETLEIEQIVRGEALVPLNADAIGKPGDWRWSIETTGGTIRMRAAGYRQYVRLAPRHQQTQSIPLSDRGGISFLQGSNR